MSVIHVEDVAGMIVWAPESESIKGPLNAVMPEPVSQPEFTRELASSRRPARDLARSCLRLAPGFRRTSPGDAR
jgi:NAD dependent epimerase/dehydratase family enzyme